ncbi:MAG: hypothetical protein ABIF10_02090 [Candidatus Woesearchaeota archaeon]
MMLPDLIKERKALKSRIAQFSGSISSLLSYRIDLNEKLSKNVIDDFDHNLALNHHSAGLYHRFELYSSMLGHCRTQLKKVNLQIAKKMNLFLLGLNAVVLLLIMGFASQGSITGHVMYSLDSWSSGNGWSLDGPTEFLWSPGNLTLSSILVSGNYSCDSGMRIFMNTSRGRLLVYAAEQASSFSLECGAACNIHEHLPSYRFEVDMPEGCNLHISRIDYACSEMQEFTVLPKNHTVGLLPGFSYSSGFVVANPLLKQFAVSASTHGDLVDSTTLHKWHHRFANDTPARFNYTVIAPKDTGVYRQTFSVMLLPDGSFTGSLPQEEYVLTVVVNSERQASSLLGYGLLSLAIIIGLQLLLLSLIIVHLRMLESMSLNRLTK